MSDFRFEKFDMTPSNDVIDIDDLTEDALAVVDLIRQIRMTPDSSEPSVLDTLADFDGQTCLVARDDEGEICAAANIRLEPEHNQMWVQQLAVDPDYRGQGLGTEFVDHIVNLARVTQLSKIKSRAAYTAIAAHYSWGFREDEDQRPSNTPIMYRYL